MSLVRRNDDTDKAAMMTTATTNMLSPTTGAASHRPSSRSRDDDLKAVPGVLKSEWIKLSSVRANTAILGLTIVMGGLTSWAVATFVTDEVLTASGIFIYSTVLTAVVASIAGILLFSSEAQHGTLAAALTAQPARWVIAFSKAITAAAFGLTLGAAGMAAGFGGAMLGGLAVGDTSAMAATTLWALLYTTLAAVLGTGIGMIVRHSSAAISGLLVWGFVIENLLTFFAPAQVSRFLPFFAGDGLLAISSDMDTPESIAAALTRAQDAMVFGGYTAVALIVGTVLLYRRDTT
ncbi:ABC transporter permease subunit [Microbispora sp. NPDC049125]|uniref:ABC transporter permease subunit n=1 Tax=Microbispora sp. NPDC049125 TaxID=3154929 RepID=UPI0034679DBD